MKPTKTRAILLASAATLSLSAAALASEFSRVVVFGDRLLDAGQFVDGATVFPEDPDAPIETDGRGRFTNLDVDGNTGQTWGTLVSRDLGHGDTNPSQPQTLDNSPPVTTGENYASGFFDSSQIRESVDGYSRMGGIIYQQNDVQRIVAGTGVPGFLADPTKTGWAANSIVLMNGGGKDVRELMEVSRDFDGSVFLNEVPDDEDKALRFVDNAANRQTQAETAAGNISSGALLLRDAGAGLVVVSNLMDQGEMPEAYQTLAGAETGLQQLREAYGPDLDTAVMSDDDQRAYGIFQQILANPDLGVEVRSAGTDAFNAQLAADLAAQDNVVVIDQNALVKEVMADPARFGLSAEGSQAQDCLYEDGLHPCTIREGFVSEQFFANGMDVTTTAQTMFAQQALAVIDAPVLVSSTPYMAIQSGRAVASAGTGQVSPELVAGRGWAPFVSGGIGQSTWNGINGEGPSGALPLSGVAGVTYSFGSVGVGIAGGYQEIVEPESDVEIAYSGDAMFGTVFAGADMGLVFGTASATVGTVNYDRIERRSRIGEAIIENGGASEADVLGGSIEVGVRALTNGTIAAGPIASVEHWQSEIDGYTEDGWEATAVSYDSIEGSSTRGSFGLFLEAGDLKDQDMPISVRLKALYTYEFDRDGAEIVARQVGRPDSSFTREGRSAQADSMTVGAQVSYDFGPLIGTLGYDGRIGENDDHYGRLDLSLPIKGGIR